MKSPGGQLLGPVPGHSATVDLGNSQNVAAGFPAGFDPDDQSSADRRVTDATDTRPIDRLWLSRNLSCSRLEPARLEDGHVVKATTAPNRAAEPNTCCNDLQKHIGYCARIFEQIVLNL